MKTRTRIAALSSCIGLASGTAVILVLARTGVAAQDPPAAEQLKKLAAEGYETDPETLKAVATGGTPMGRWKEGLTFDGVAPMPWLKSAANWFPKTEEVQPDEIRVTFMGSSPMPRPGQMGTSVYVELGNGNSFIFDMGPGSIANYLAAGVSLNRLNNIFLTHLHWDHVDSVAYTYMFGAWAGRWHETFRITGPSGTKPEYGTRYMMDRMKEMLTWHRASFDQSPIGKGFDMEVNEFDFATTAAWPTRRTASRSRTGANRTPRTAPRPIASTGTACASPSPATAVRTRSPSSTPKGCDLLITEVQPELMAISAAVNGVMPVIGRNTVDSAHNSGYAAGYLLQQGEAAHGHDHAHGLRRLFQPGAAGRDPLPLQGALPFRRARHGGGEPDARQGLGTRRRDPDFPSQAPPKFDIAAMGGLVIPAPRNRRQDFQEQSIRDAEIPPDDYYPKGYKPELIPFWPTSKPIFIPAGQGAAWLVAARQACGSRRSLTGRRGEQEPREEVNGTAAKGGQTSGFGSKQDR